MVIEEQGRDLELSVDGAPFVGFDAGPMRMGIGALAIAGDRMVGLRPRADNGIESRREITARVSLECPEAPAHADLLDCLPAVSAMAADRATTFDESRATPLCAALIAHARGALASKQGRNADAAAQYAVAARQWRVLGDETRAAIADFARLETWFRTGQSEASIARASEISARLETLHHPFFAARARMVGCLAQARTGRFDAARDCMIEVAEAQARLGEWSAAGNVWVALCTMLATQGRDAELRATLARVEALGEARFGPLASGRLANLRADMALSEGRVGEALAQIDLAYARFEQERNVREQMNSALRGARILLDLGALTQARLAVDRALALADYTQLAPRVGAALVLRANIELESGRLESAWVAAREAGRAFTTASMPAALLEARALETQIAVALALPVPSDSTNLPKDAGTLPTSARVAMRIIAAMRAVSTAKSNEAVRELRAALDEPLDLRDRVRVTRLLAEHLARAGRAPEAMQLLEPALVGVRRLTERARPLALRYLLAQRAAALLRTWVDVYAQLPEGERPAPDVVWQTVLTSRDWRWSAAVLDEPTTPAITSSRASAAEFDEAVSRMLLPAEGDAPDARAFAAERRLLAYLGAAGQGQEAAPTPSPAPTLPTANADELTMMYVIGDTHAFLLTRSPAGTQVFELSSPPRIDAARRAMLSALRGPEVPMAEVQAAARELSTVLLPEAARIDAKRVNILADEALQDVPFALLAWPSQSTTLGDAAALSMIDAPSASASPLTSSGDLAVLLADMPNVSDPRLPRLQALRGEAERIAASLPTRRVRTISDSSLTRAALGDALRASDQWLHLAAHGVNLPRMQGYAGVWLPPTAGTTTPRFVSWMELVEQPLHAELAVLNACDLAAAPIDAAGGAASFAQALSAAGVRHVVAALWPVSDAATFVWVPAFYAELDRARDPAMALQAARAALERSRRFRHPYYWASLTYYARGDAR